MAVKNNKDSTPARGVVLILWETVTQADTGAPVKAAQYSDKTVQVVGTFGGTTCTMQGSNDGSTWFSLTDLTGTAIAFTAAGAKLIAENPLYIRPSCSGGAGADLDIYVVGRA